MFFLIGIIFHSLTAALEIPVLFIMGSALAKMVSWIPPSKSYVRHVKNSELLIYYIAIYCLIYWNSYSFSLGFGFLVDEQGNMVKKPQVSAALVVFWFNFQTLDCSPFISVLFACLLILYL